MHSFIKNSFINLLFDYLLLNCFCNVQCPCSLLHIIHLGQIILLFILSNLFYWTLDWVFLFIIVFVSLNNNFASLFYLFCQDLFIWIIPPAFYAMRSATRNARGNCNRISGRFRDADTVEKNKYLLTPCCSLLSIYVNKSKPGKCFQLKCILKKEDVFSWQIFEI